MKGPARTGAANLESPWYAMPGVVYVIRVADRIKVGFTTSPPLRLGQLLHALGDLELVALLPATRRLERELHEWLRPLSLGGGDWFVSEPSAVQFFRALHQTSTLSPSP